MSSTRGFFMSLADLRWRAGVALRRAMPWHKATIYDLAPKALWEQEIAEGFVMVGTHPTLPLRVLNYGKTVQYANRWNAATINARGLIVDDRNRIVVRGFPKFQNYGQAGAPTPAMDARVRVMDKADGSLGILVPLGDGEFSVATRGSFSSEQAQHATKVWEQKYAHQFTPRAGLSYLFEIVYPSNRIVLDYGDMDDLILLEILDTQTGATILYEDVRNEWPGPQVEVLPFRTFGEVLAADIPDDREGFVVHLPDTNERVKRKGERYLQLHRILTQVSSKDLWENLAVARMVADGVDVKQAARYAGIPVAEAQAIADSGDAWLAEILEVVPDEYYRWVQETLAGFEAAVAAYVAEATVAFEALGLTGDPRNRDDRKAMAKVVAERAKDKGEHARFMTLMNGGSLLGPAFAACKPEYSKAFWSMSDDDA